MEPETQADLAGGSFLDAALGAGATPAAETIEIVVDPDPTDPAATAEDGGEPDGTSPDGDDGGLRHTDRFVRTLSRALDGDGEALARLQATREGRRVLREIEAKATVRQAETARAWTEYDRLAALKTDDPYTFGQWMADDKWRSFFDQMARKVPERTATPAPSNPGTLDAVERLYERVQKKAESAVLTDADWASLDPDRFTGTPDAALEAFTDAYSTLLARRTAERVTGPAKDQAREMRAQQDAIRAAAAQAPPEHLGGASPQRMTFRELQARWIRELEEGRLTSTTDDAYQRALEARGDASWLPGG